MRRLFIEQGNKFFKSKLGVSLTSPQHVEKLEDKIEDINIQKSRIVNFLPFEDLVMVASHPCFIDMGPKNR